MTFTDEQRARIISEIASWKVAETEFEITDGVLEQHVENLRECDDAALKSWWDGTVGEWVASRQDVTTHPDVCFETILADETRPYGFTQWVEVEP